MTALKARNEAAMETEIVELRTLDPDDPYLGWMAVEVALLNNDWIAAKQLLEAEFALIRPCSPLWTCNLHPTRAI